MQRTSVTPLQVCLWLSPGTPAMLWADPWNGKVVLQAFWRDCWNTHCPQDWYIDLAKRAPRPGDTNQKGTVAMRSRN